MSYPRSLSIFHFRSINPWDCASMAWVLLDSLCFERHICIWSLIVLAYFSFVFGFNRVLVSKAQGTRGRITLGGAVLVGSCAREHGHGGTRQAAACARQQAAGGAHVAQRSSKVRRPGAAQTGPSPGAQAKVAGLPAVEQAIAGQKLHSVSFSYSLSLLFISCCLAWTI